MSTAFVLTGDNTLADIDALPEEARPAHIHRTLDPLVPEAIWAGR